MSLEFQICLAVLLDLILGDPRWFPHPVKFMGRFAMALEAPARRTVRNPRTAGIMVAAAVTLATGAVAFGLIEAARYVHPHVADAVSVLLIYSGVAARDLADHSRAVWNALAEQNLETARTKVSLICGRDTASLDETGIARATVESVAENMVDGVTAPLFFAVVAGPVGMMVYKAVNTLDSTFGYKNERYIEFGWASARFDDVLTFVPARLTALCVPLGALLIRERSLGALRILIRDRGRHPSPNAGQSEAAMSGALGVQLGGQSVYGGVTMHKPTLGDPLERLGAEHILRANTLMLVTAGLVASLLLGVRILAGLG